MTRADEENSHMNSVILSNEVWHQRIASVITRLPGALPYDNHRPLRVQQRYAGLGMLDFLCAKHGHLGRDFWQQALSEDRVLYRGRVAYGDEPVAEGAELTHIERQVTEPLVDGKIRRIYEDEALLVLDKPAPLPIHPCGRFNKNTVLGILAVAFSGSVFRPVHRLDANTTGLILLAKTPRAAKQLADQLAQGVMQKRYLAEVDAEDIPVQFQVRESIESEPVAGGKRALCAYEPVAGGKRALCASGKEALTEFYLLATAAGRCLLEARPITGRTNQIRLHLAGRGFPIVGDRAYGKSSAASAALVDNERLHLHAWRVLLIHPITKQTLSLVAPPPGWALSFTWKPGDGDE